MVTCSICSVSFCDAYTLKRHVDSVHSKISFSCQFCKKDFSRQDNLQVHEKRGKCTSSTKPKISCEFCDKPFKTAYSLSRHVKNVHEGISFTCRICEQNFTQQDNLRIHENKRTCKRKAEDLPSTSTGTGLPPPHKKRHSSGSLRTALERHVKEFEIPVHDGGENLHLYLNNRREEFSEHIRNAVKERQGVKWLLTVKVHFTRPNWIKEDDERETDSFFQSGTFIALPSSDIEADFEKAVVKIVESMQNFLREGSGWKYDCVLSTKLTVTTYQPLAASSYIPLPTKLASIKAIINVQNQDQRCLLWCVLAYLHPVVKNPQRTAKYLPYLNELNIEGMDFPTPLNQVPKFAKQNNLSISIYGYENKEGIYPLLISDNVEDRHVDVMLITDGTTTHYTYIKDMNRLLNHLTKYKGRMYHCRFCLHRFMRPDLLQKHIESCRHHTPQKTVFPEEGENIMKFNSIRKQLACPFIIYGDFECFSVKIQGPLPERSHTRHLTELVPCSFALVVVSPNGSLFQEPVLYRGKNVLAVFFEKLLEIQSVLTPLMQRKEPLVMTEEDELNFTNATHCYICGNQFGTSDVKVRDHDHIQPGRNYRGAAHQNCNLEFKICEHIPVVFHNLRHFDSHLIAQGIGSVKDQEITCIANNFEKYVAFSVGNLRFIDSIQFLPASLETLTSNLATSGENSFKCLKQHFPTNKIPLLLRKGVFPYSYLDGEARFQEKELPVREAFFNDLTESDISEEDYKHAQNVWNTFEMSNLGEYHDLYLLLDTLLLCDIFQNFRFLCLEFYKLDAAQYYTLPGLAWDACLLKTGVELELLTDSEMYLFVERGIRGGISMISHRHSVANNKYLNNFDRSKESSFIGYFDCNNLYGTSMVDYLPVNNFKWVNNDLDVTQVPDDSEIGYILEVDLTYPAHLHETHSMYPLAPETMEISESMLSPYSKDLLNTLGLKHHSIPKLVPNLQPKTKYVLHYRNLKLYLSLGMELTKIHRVLAFSQSRWMKSYIDFNTHRRQVAPNSFQKDLFKLFSNAVFGKSMEDVRKRRDIHLVQTPKKLKKLVAKPSFKSTRIFNEDLVGVEIRKVTVKLNKPIYLGLTVLELSKVVMYKFHYEKMIPKYGSRLKLNFTDTDSFCYSIQTEDLYKDLLEDADLYDLSDYPKDHFLYSDENKKVLGKFKDEVPGGIIREFVGLRPKCYSILTTLGEKRTAKGVTKATAKRNLTHDKYKQCLLDHKIIYAEMKRIDHKDHKLYTSEINKISLSPTDDKRYIQHDGISTLAHGHFKISTL